MGKTHKKTNSGEALEELVSSIERALLPQQFRVQSRRRVFGETGTQLAELDIEITGKLGTLPYRVLIECRDRPSQGNQGSDWIEQLAGRRIRFQFNQAVAVSTTGFTPSAIDAGRTCGVILRDVKTITEIGSDFAFRTSGGVVVFGGFIKTGTTPRVFSKQPLPPLSGVRKLRIRSAEAHEFSDFPNCTLDRLREIHPEWFNVGPDVLEDIEWNTGPVELLIEDHQQIPLTNIHAVLTFQKRCFQGQVFQIWDYTESGTRIGYIADFATPTPQGDVLHTVFVPTNEDGSENAPIVLNTRVK